MCDSNQDVAISPYAKGYGYYHTNCFQTRDPELMLGDGHHGWYCSYCGKECQSRDEWDERDIVETYYHCDCEDAQKEVEIRLEISRVLSNASSEVHDLRAKLPEIDREMIEERKYEFELMKLKRRYGKLPQGYTIKNLEKEKNILFKKFS